MGKKVNSNLYTITRLVYNNEDGWHYEELENNRLYSKTKFPTNITIDDLPENFVKGRYYKNQGYINAKGVKDLRYKPNYLFNHLHKDDVLYISYRGIIEEYVDSFYGYPETAYRNFDYAIDGNNILNFILAVKKYSPDVKTDEIEKSMIKKVEWFIKRWPEDAKMVSAEKYLNELKELFCK